MTVLQQKKLRNICYIFKSFNYLAKTSDSVRLFRRIYNNFIFLKKKDEYSTS